MRRVMAMLAAVRALQPAARGARRPRTRLHATKVEGPSMDQVVQLCRQRGFVFGSSEIYNGFNGFYDYGPLGCELKKNIKDLWWRDFVHGREDVHGLDSSIIASPAVWRASGHVDGFSDPMCDDKETKKRYRADQLFVGDVVDDLNVRISTLEAALAAAESENSALRPALVLAARARPLQRDVLLRLVAQRREGPHPFY